MYFKFYYALCIHVYRQTDEILGKIKSTVVDYCVIFFSQTYFISKLKCQCHLNLAACFLKSEDYNKVTEHCTSALELEPDNLKGLFRRGQAYAKLHEYEKAKKDFTEAQGLDQENKAVINQLRQIDFLMKKEKQMYQKMFAS